MSDKTRQENLKRKEQKDAEGQFARSDKGKDNNGVASAKPRVITGRDDATTSEKRGRKDWKLHHDEGEASDGEFHG